jgi:hypothetical protein
MHRSIPTPNKLLQKKWTDINFEMHQQRIAHIKPVVRNTPPLKTHLGTSKSKKERIAQDRVLSIERENAALVERMSTIMRSSSSTRSLATSPTRSLNRDLRKRKLVQQTIENLSLLNRLQGQKSSYEAKKLEDNRRFHERMLRHICEYPYSLGRSSSTRGLTLTDFQGLRSKPTMKSLGSTKPRRLNPLENESLVYKDERKIGEQVFVVIVTRSSKHLTIVVQEQGSQESFSMKLTLKEAVSIMGGSTNYSKLASALEVEDGELVLAGPRKAGGSLPHIDYELTTHLWDSEQTAEGKPAPTNEPQHAFVFPESDREEDGEKVLYVSEKPTMDKKLKSDLEAQGSFSFESSRSEVKNEGDTQHRTQLKPEELKTEQGNLTREPKAPPEELKTGHGDLRKELKAPHEEHKTEQGDLRKELKAPHEETDQGDPRKELKAPHEETVQGDLRKEQELGPGELSESSESSEDGSVSSESVEECLDEPIN